MTALQRAALEYAARGWKIFPIAPGAKKPPLTAHGFLDASNDEDQIRAWWRAHPRANIGLACRASGLVVLDIDPRNGGEKTFAALVEELGPLPACCEAHTPSGGRHLYFADPGGSLRGQLGPGIDIKAEGYVLLPPSEIAGGNGYGWIDASD